MKIIHIFLITSIIASIDCTATKYPHATPVSYASSSTVSSNAKKFDHSISTAIDRNNVKPIGKEEKGKDKERNLVMEIFQGIGHSFTKGRRATGQLWTNYNLVRSIRRRYKSSPSSITYSEYSLMNRGVEDRWKIINIIMAMTFAKDVAPYMIMYNPGMLPSTFSSRFYVDSDGSGAPVNQGVTQGYVEELIDNDRVRAHAVISALNHVEDDCVKAGFLESLNPFGKQAVNRRMDNLKVVAGVIRTAMSMDPDRVCEDFLERFCFREGYGQGGKRDKDMEKLKGVPKSLVVGLGMCHGITGKFGPIGIPHWFVRGQLTKHIEKVIAADNFVLGKCVAEGDAFLDKLDVSELLEIASDRLILSPKCGKGEISAGVKKWYGDVKRQEGLVMKKVEVGDHGEEGQPKGFVKVMGRAMLLGVNAVKTVRDGRCEARLVPSLYQWRK